MRNNISIFSAYRRQTEGRTSFGDGNVRGIASMYHALSLAAAFLLACAVLLAGCSIEQPSAATGQSQPQPSERLPHPYTCSNGTPTSGTVATANNELCASCNAGYMLSDNLCVSAHPHTCANGTPTSGTVADANSEHCALCNVGYTLSGNLCVSAGTFTIPLVSQNGNPYGLWSDGTTMWVVDREKERIFAYNMETKTRDITKEIKGKVLRDAGNENPVGLWSDGSTFWVADEEDQKIYAYNIATKMHDSTQDFSNLDMQTQTPIGIWSDGDVMWVATDGFVGIYTYDMTTKLRHRATSWYRSRAEIPQLSTRPAGMWADGTTFWVADWEEDKIYPYNMETKKRDTDKGTIALDSDNILPIDVWSDGEVMWVLDRGYPSNIYAYNVETQAHIP